MKLTMLVIEDNLLISRSYVDYFSDNGFQVVIAGTLAEAGRLIQTCRYDAVLLDVFLPDGNGVDFIPELRAACPSTAIVMITGMGDIQLAVEAMSRGADNFLTKPLDLGVLHMFLNKQIEAEQIRRRERARRLTPGKDSCIMNCRSSAMASCANDAVLAARHDSPVLIMGETGTGKSILARWLHDNSPRASGPFVSVNCSSLKGEILGSELFGHARGAFTGAIKDREGLVEFADCGTLFLDEIGDMSLAVQAELLNVIEQKAFRRVGESRTRTSDFRLISATNRDIFEDIRAARFRQDLYYRISTLTITMPPLRERIEDLPLIISEISAELGLPQQAISPGALTIFQRYAWPGNIRELRNIMERAAMFKRIDVSAELVRLQNPSANNETANSNKPAKPVALSRQTLIAALKNNGGNREATASSLGISRTTLYRRMKSLGLV